MTFKMHILCLLMAGVCSTGWAGQIEVVGPQNSAFVSIAGVVVSPSAREIAIDLPAEPAATTAESDSAAQPAPGVHETRVVENAFDPILSPLDGNDRFRLLFYTTSFHQFAIDPGNSPSNCLPGFPLEECPTVWVEATLGSVGDFAVMMSEWIEAATNPLHSLESTSRWTPGR